MFICKNIFNEMMPTRISACFLYIIVFMFACTGSPEKKVSEENNDQDTMSTTAIKNILFFGNSLTAGYGLEPGEAFPELIQKKIDSLGLPYRTINAGLSGETTAGGNARIDWLLKQRIDVFVLELGANDGLRGLPVKDTYTNLQSIVDKVKKAWPDCKIVLTGMLVPPSMGLDYSEDFKSIFPKLAKENDLVFVPFLLERVAGESHLNQQDGVHPTKEGQVIMAETVWNILKTIL